VIGTIFDTVYPYASILSPTVNGVQTVTVPPGGATIVELSLPVPGRFVIVDHALSRMEHGLAGYLIAEGPTVPDVYHANADPVVPSTKANPTKMKH
jgi:nitrite reductase (NO-forming)